LLCCHPLRLLHLIGLHCLLVKAFFPQYFHHYLVVWITLLLCCCIAIVILLSHLQFFFMFVHHDDGTKINWWCNMWWVKFMTSIYSPTS
jgi:hypothetical protein